MAAGERSSLCRDALTSVLPGTNIARAAFTAPLLFSICEVNMGNLLYWAVVFLIVALVAAFLGFGGVAGVATDGARILFWVAIILVVLSFVGGLLRRG
jgi:uncharacterized membrane protein YtjA (UPF0391 family)